MTEKIRILIVEDEGLVAEDLKETLNGIGYEVPGIADTGEGAIALAAEHQPDLILMDINLSGDMDGITAGGEIRSRWGIPIIYLTAFATQAIIDRAKKTVPSGYILKPFNERQIQTAIEIALYNATIERQLKERDDTIRTLLNATDNLSLLLDAQGTIMALNDAMAKQAGKSPEQLIDTPFSNLPPGGCITARLTGSVQQAGFGKPLQFEEETSGVWYDNSIIPVSDSRGIVRLIAVYCTDISARKTAEITQKSLNEQLLAEKNRLAMFMAALDSMDDLVIITSAFGDIMYVNGAFEKKIGYSLTEVKGKNIQELAAPENQFALGKGAFLSDQRSVWNGRFITKNKFGFRIPLLLKSSPVIIDTHTNNRVFVLRDVPGGGDIGIGSPPGTLHKANKM